MVALFDPQLTPELNAVHDGGCVSDTADRSDADQQLPQQVAVCLPERHRVPFRRIAGTAASATALYDYRNIEGIPNPTIFSTAYSATAAPFRQTGNTVFDIDGLLNTQNGTQNYLWGLASKFHELNLSSSLDIGFVGPTHAILEGDWVDNFGFDENEILQRTGFLVDKQTRAGRRE